MSVIHLPWVQEGKRWVARTIYGIVLIKPMQEPWTKNGSFFSNPFGKPRVGWGVFLKDKRIGWVVELKDAAHLATAHITLEANARASK